MEKYIGQGFYLQVIGNNWSIEAITECTQTQGASLGELEKQAGHMSKNKGGEADKAQPQSLHRTTCEVAFVTILSLAILQACHTASPVSPIAHDPGPHKCCYSYYFPRLMYLHHWLPMQSPGQETQIN